MSKHITVGALAAVSVFREWRRCDESGWNAGRGAWTSDWILI